MKRLLFVAVMLVLLSSISIQAEVTFPDDIWVVFANSKYANNDILTFELSESYSVMSKAFVVLRNDLSQTCFVVLEETENGWIIAAESDAFLPNIAIAPVLYAESFFELHIMYFPSGEFMGDQTPVLSYLLRLESGRWIVSEISYSTRLDDGADRILVFWPTGKKTKYELFDFYRNKPSIGILEGSVLYHETELDGFVYNDFYTHVEQLLIENGYENEYLNQLSTSDVNVP